MYKIALILGIFFIGTSLIAQYDGNIRIDQSRIPELPQTHPSTIAVNPTAIPVPTPPDLPTNSEVGPRDTFENRLVFFVPGFGGVRDRWTRAAEATEIGAGSNFPGRQCNASLIEYVQNGTLFSGVNEVADAIRILSNGHDQTTEEKMGNFLIGHSQGGIVANDLAYYDTCDDSPQAPGLYGGIVTVNSSLNGAEIMRSRNVGDIEDLANRVCNVFIEDLLANVPDLILRFLPIDDQGNISNSGDLANLCDLLRTDYSDSGEIERKSLLNMLFGGLSQNIGNDYLPGAAVINAINECPRSGIQKIAIYGIEPYTQVPGSIFLNPIFYRTVQHFFEDVNKENFGEANDDSKLAQKATASAIKALLQSILDGNKAEDWFNRYIYLISINRPVLAAIALKRHKEFLERKRRHFAVFQLYHDINDEWMLIIGAKGQDHQSVQTGTNHYCSCLINTGTDIRTIRVPVNSQSECTHPDAISCNYSSFPDYTLVTTFFEKESDGVVLAESAKHMTGDDVLSIRQSVPDFINNEIDTGSSHMQARNDRNLRYMLRELYDGNLGGWFYIKPN